MLDNIGHPQNPPENQIQHLIKLYNQGKLGEVFEQTSTLTKQYPNSLVLWNLLGASAAQTGKLDKAIDAFKKAISIKPDYADAYNNMGNALKGQGKLEEAIEAYNKVLSIKPDYAEAYYNIGNVLKEQGQLEEAVEAYKKALSIQPEYAEAYYNMGIALQDQGKLDEAVSTYNKALSIKPEYALAYYNMGNALHKQGKLDKAIEAYKNALSIQPNNADAYYNMGVSLKDQSKLEEAVVAYKKALKINPNFESAVWNCALCWLMIGDFDKGWELWQRRFLHGELKERKRNFKTAKLWNGEKNIKSIMLWREQGLGDEMMFANYFHLIKSNNRVIEVSPRLESIFKRSFPNDTVRAQLFDAESLYSPNENYQYHMPFGEVGPIFNIGKKVDPKAYLVPDPKLTTEWSKIRENKKLTIGLSWRSGLMAKGRVQHYSSLDQWTRLLQSEKVRVICTQYSDIDEDIKSLEPDVRKRLYVPDVDMKNDIEALAAILSNCDLVVGPSSATTMLAGSLGRRTTIFAHRHNYFVSGHVTLGKRGRHPWLENGEVHIFDQSNQELVINNIIDEIISSENIVYY